MNEDELLKPITAGPSLGGGMGMSSPPPSAPSPPTSDYDGGTNQFRSRPSAPLDALVDKIMNTSASPGRRLRALTEVAQTQGQIQVQGMRDESAQALNQATNATHVQTANIGIQPQMMQQERLAKPWPGGIGGMAPAATPQAPWHLGDPRTRF